MHIGFKTWSWRAEVAFWFHLAHTENSLLCLERKFLDKHVCLVRCNAQEKDRRNNAVHHRLIYYILPQAIADYQLQSATHQRRPIVAMLFSSAVLFAATFLISE